MGMTWTEWRGRAELIDVEGFGVATYDLGDPQGTVSTFVHGYPSASVDIAPVLDLLAPGHRLLAIDLPGFGASAKEPGRRLTIHGAADAVVAMWAHRGIASTLLVAHDYSVSVAQELLAR